MAVDIRKLDPDLMDALMERGHSPEKVATMDAEDMFVEYCEWNGLINWGRTLWRLQTSLRSNSRASLTEAADDVSKAITAIETHNGGGLDSLRAALQKVNLVIGQLDPT